MWIDLTLQNQSAVRAYHKLPKLLSECSAQSDLPRFPLYTLSLTPISTTDRPENLPSYCFLQFFPVFYSSPLHSYIKNDSPAMWTVGLPKYRHTGANAQDGARYISRISASIAQHLMIHFTFSSVIVTLSFCHRYYFTSVLYFAYNLRNSDGFMPTIFSKH